MNKRQILASLNKLANELDNTGLYKEANSLTYVMKRLAEEESTPEQKRTMMEYKSSTENYIPRWIQEQMEREKNPITPEVLHPSEIETKRKVDEILPEFMEEYEIFWDNSNINLPWYIDPRLINETTVNFLFDGGGNPNEYLKNKISNMSDENYKNFFEENLDFVIKHIEFIQDFMNKNGLDAGKMERLLRKSRNY
jgi:hypothetical protein